MNTDAWARLSDSTLDNIGVQIPMRPFRQGFWDMSPAFDKLERLVAKRKLCHGANPILNMCAAGAVVQSDPARNKKLHKAKRYSKIDGLVALAMALGCMRLGVRVHEIGRLNSAVFAMG